ncbi:MAG: hypothetical protein F4W68_01055 [Cenarchaeum sp. SB0661_bin_35]|nr:hypothetical protein [Cenarchaeum sp. SB0667_bin_13]MYC79083.1 hypothetical protein [Cenarchaeum sp. SB0661_bin_35]MYI51944.1 hypothetical protein [Cenarchaeum sp. SB0673_bin_9]
MKKTIPLLTAVSITIIGTSLFVVNSIERESNLHDMPPISIADHNSEFDAEWYRDAELDHPFDEVVRDRWVAGYDFQQDFNTEPRQALAHHIQAERLLGTYDPTAHERKYHDWILSQYGTHNSLEDTQNALVEIVGEDLHRIHSLYEIVNRNANLGDIAFWAFEEDPDYWIKVLAVGTCSVKDYCDTYKVQESIDNNRELTADEIADVERQIKEDEENYLDNGPEVHSQFVLPYVHTVTKEHMDNEVNVRVNVSSCHGDDSCSFSGDGDGVGFYQASAHSGQRHASGRASLSYNAWSTSDTLGVRLVSRYLCQGPVYHSILHIMENRLWVYNGLPTR